MKQDIIELLATDEVATKFQKLKPWENCKKCDNGVIIETGEICQCSLEVILSLILNVPERYNINFRLNDSIKNQIGNNKFLVLTGENKYIKLVGYGIGKEKIKSGKLVKYIDTKQTIEPQDIAAFKKADVVLFEDIYKNRSDFAFKNFLLKRIDDNKETIFFGKTDIIEFDEDFLEIEVDTSDIKIL
jgi:hypothetical protein